jgi:trans-aconitate methyltransferase
VEWVRGALLTHYEALLDAERYEQFLTQYREELRAALGDKSPFFYTYKRVLMWGSF